MNLTADLGVKFYWPDEGTEAGRGRRLAHAHIAVGRGRSDSRGSAQRLQA